MQSRSERLKTTFCCRLYRIRYDEVMDVAQVIRKRRQRAGLSQDALATAAVTSQPTIAAYEAGRVVPSVPTLSRILESCGHSLAVEPSTTHVRWTRVEEKSLAIHRAIAARLLTDPMPVLTKAHHNLDTLRDSDLGHASHLLNEWDHLLNGPVDEIVTTLLARTQRAIDLRQMTPFAGVLTDAERRSILQSVPRRVVP